MVTEITGNRNFHVAKRSIIPLGGDLLMKTIVNLLITGILITAETSYASQIADEYVWGNNANFGSSVITLTQADVTTGTVVSSFSPDGGTFGNGRGILVLGTTIYWTMVGSADVFITKSVTHANDGV